MAQQRSIYLCLLCIVLAHFTAAHAQGGRSSRQSIGSDIRNVEVDTADDGSSVNTTAQARGAHSASASATSSVSSDGSKTTTSGKGSAESDGDSVGLEVTSERGLPLEAEAPSPVPIAPSPVDETPVPLPAPTPALTPAPAPQTQEKPTPLSESDAGAPVRLAPAPETAETEIVIVTPYGVTKTDSSELAEFLNQLFNDKNKEEEEQQEGDEKQGGEKHQEQEAPRCWGEAAYRCCGIQDYVTNKKGTFCGCSESYKRWGIGYCRFKMISDNPTVWKDLTHYPTRAGRTCQCQEKGPRECSGVTKVECCDDYDGQSDKCRCIYAGSDRERCFWKKSQDNPLIWEDDLFIKGRKCICPGS